MSKITTDKKNIDQLYNLYYQLKDNIVTVVTNIVNTLGLMKKSDYDTNDDGIVDKAESATCGSSHTISFAIDPITNEWGYKKDGADTVYPFKKGSIDPSDANASEWQVLSGATFYAGNDTKKTGTMARIDVKNSKPFNDHVINVTEGGQYNIAWKPSASSAIINSYVGQENYEGPQIVVAVNVPGSSSSLQDYKYGDAKMGGSNYNVTPDSGYDGLKKVIIRPIDSSSNPNVVTLWTGNSSGATATGSFTASLSASYKSYTYIRIWFRSNRSYATEFCWMDSVAHIDAVNNTSTNMLAISCRSIASSGQTSGNVFARTFRFSGNTSMVFNNGTQVTSGSGSSNSNVCIPYKIEGIY